MEQSVDTFYADHAGKLHMTVDKMLLKSGRLLHGKGAGMNIHNMDLRCCRRK